jgi:hypothetical protein
MWFSAIPQRTPQRPAACGRVSKSLVDALVVKDQRFSATFDFLSRDYCHRQPDCGSSGVK